MKKKLKLVAIVLSIAAALLASPLWAGSGQFVTPSAGHGPATLPDHRLVQKMQVFTANGTWTRPANVDVVHVTLVGGGGAGGSTTSSDTRYGGNIGGDGGQTVFKRTYPVTGNVSVVVGQGGNAAGSVAENHGGDSSFGSLVAKGGVGARRTSGDRGRQPTGADCRVSSVGNSGASGTGSGQKIPEGLPTYGGDCGLHRGGRSPTRCTGAGGGASSMGDGGDGGRSRTNGNAGTGYGAGGGGAGCRGATGGNGASGVVIVEWWEWIEIRVPIFSNRAPNPYP